MRRVWGLCAVFVVSCASSFQRIELKGLPASGDHPDAKWTVLLDEKEVSFELGKNGPEAVETERWRIKVLKPTTVPSVVVGYSRTFESVQSIRGRIISPEGIEKPLDVSRQSDHPASDRSVLFGDSRVVVVPVPPVPVGGIFESEIVTRHGTMQHFAVFSLFGGEEPVARQRVVISAPKGWDIRYAWTNSPKQPGPTIEERNGRTVWVFEEKDLPEHDNESMGASLAARLPRLAVRLEKWFDNGEQHPPATPEELSRGIAMATLDRAIPTPEIQDAVKKILVGVEDTPETKARALYEYVCREVQYCAIEVGLGGWYPHPAKDVHAARYGDCKDKANYLRTLLSVAGITAYQTAIYAHDGTPRQFSLPSLGANFNHEILAIELPQGLVFADPTWRSVPFGELPPSDQGAPVLLISQQGHSLSKTPESTPEQNTERQRTSLKLTSNGDAEGDFALVATGARALPWKSRWIEGSGQRRRWVEEQLWFTAPLVRSVNNKTGSDFARSVEVEGTIGVRRVAADAGPNKLVLRPSDLFQPWFRSWKRERESPLVSSFAERRTQEVVLALPPGSTLGTRVEDIRLSGPLGAYTLRTRFENGALIIERSLERKERIIPVDTIGALNAFTRKVLEAENAPILVKLGGAP